MQHNLKLLTLFLVFLSVSRCKAKIVEPEVPQARVVGGSTAKKGFAPYQVALLDLSGYTCGGAIIDVNWILTAAHCVAQLNATDITVITGTQNLADSDGVPYYVDRIYRHCNYEIRQYSSNDIALLRLKDSIVLNERTQIIPLPTQPMREGDKVILTGWGREKNLGTNPDRLKMVALKYMGYKKCKKAHKGDKRIDVGHICTFTRSGEGSCYGDSGGPLASNGVLVGVVNWGVPCGVGYPDMYASTYFYLDWIRTILSCNERCKLNAVIW